MKVVVTSSKRTRAPKRIVTFSTEIITLQFYRRCGDSQQIKESMLGGALDINIRRDLMCSNGAIHEKTRHASRPCGIHPSGVIGAASGRKGNDSAGEGNPLANQRLDNRQPCQCWVG